MLESAAKDRIQEEALTAAKPHKRCGVHMGMGVGKTYLAIKHMLQRYTDTQLFLYVIPNLDRIKGVNKELEDRGLEFLKAHIVFTTYLSLNKHEPESYDGVYLDEAHKIKPTHKLFLESFSGFIFAFTGTWPDEQNKTFDLLKRFAPLCYTYVTTDAIDDEILNDYKIYVHFLKLDKRANFKKKNYTTSEQKDYNMWCKLIDQADPHQLEKLRLMRMKSMQKYQTKIDYAKKLLDMQQVKALAFLEYTDQADFVCEYSIHSKNGKLGKENLRKFKDGEITKLSSVNQISEGENIPNLVVGIIAHAYANEYRTAQRIGRFLRLLIDEKAVLHLLCYEDTVDYEWVRKALKRFHKDKIFRFKWQI